MKTYKVKVKASGEITSIYAEPHQWVDRFGFVNHLWVETVDVGPSARLFDDNEIESI